MIWIDKTEIPVDLVIEVVKKIPQIKSFNLGTSIAVRYSSCVTVLAFVKSTRLEMSFVLLMRKMAPSSVLILEEKTKTDQLE